MKINILLPFFLDRPGGGVKVMYQYANLLAERGHDVIIYHAKKTRWLHRKSFRSWYLYFLQRFLGKKVVKYPPWFLLNTSIQSFQIVWVSNHFIRDADIVFSTWWATAIEMEELSPSKGNKFNLIQDDGSHCFNHQLELQQSYRLPVHYLAISKHIQELFFKHTQKSIPLLPNGLDHREFFVRKPIESRSSTTIMMLYSQEEGKGSKYGLSALKLVLEKYPNLHVILFGTPRNPPQDLPINFSYHCNPHNLVELYNQSAIFVSPSLQEGWGLPPMEAMACGCACVCTRIDGHMEFMNEDTAILVNPQNPVELSTGIIKLIAEPNLRYQLANRGIERVSIFSIEESVNKLERIFLLKVNEVNT